MSNSQSSYIPKKILNRFSKKRTEIALGATEIYKTIHRLERLKMDLSTFRDDINFLNSKPNSGEPTIIYCCDYTEVSAYQKPEDRLYHYLYDIESKSCLAPGSVHYRRTIAKRWYRLKHLLFSTGLPVIIFPSHMKEVDDDIGFLRGVLQQPVDIDKILTELSRTAISPKKYDLVRSILLTTESGPITESNLARVTEFFDEFSPALAALTFDKKIEARTRLDRLRNFLNFGNFQGVDTFPWENVCGENTRTKDEIRNIDLDRLINRVCEIEQVLQKLRHASMHSNFVDAQALVYIDEINKVFKKNGMNHIRLQMVSSSLQMFRVDEGIPDRYLCANVRHPKFLAACLDAKTQIWKDLQNEHKTIMNAIDLYLDHLNRLKKHKQSKISSDEIVDELRGVVADAWVRLETVLFAKESNEGTNIQEWVCTNDLLMSDIMPRGRQETIVEFLNFLKVQQFSFNNYIVQTFRGVFIELGNSYLLKFALKPLDQLEAHYFDDPCGNASVISVRLDSPRMRHMLQFYDKKIIEIICKESTNYKSFGEIVKDILETVELNTKYEVSLMKAMIVSTYGNWRITRAFCDFALEEGENFSNKQPLHEGYFLRHLAFRRLSFETREQKKDCVKYFSFAKADIEEALKGQRDHPRFVLAYAAAELEYFCFPQFDPSRAPDSGQVNDQLGACKNVAQFLIQDLTIPYNRYMFARSLQIQLSYYCAEEAGLLAHIEPKIDKNIAKKWVDQLNDLDIGKDTEFGFPGIEFIKNACNLLFNFYKMNEKECVDVFNDIYRHCEGLSNEGFFRFVALNLKRKLFYQICSKYPAVKEIASTKWPKIIDK